MSNRRNHGRGACRRCGHAIYWFKSKAGKFYPCSSDYYRDFHRCEGDGPRDQQARDAAWNVARDLAADTAIIERIIAAGYRSLAQKFHPDHGGDAAIMQQLNRVTEELRKRFMQ
jgi:hypothetical protein